ncbi:MAG: 2-C-methyl-D-erythritol 4-phosphate cytidylyltransferase [Candidatus Dormibacteria bacterium]
MSTALLLAAAGRGLRMGEDKLFADVEGRPLIAHTLRAAARADVFGRVVIAAPPARHEEIRHLATLAGLAGAVLAAGGERRPDSVHRALELAGDVDIVAVHDAARPLCPPQLFVDCVQAATRHGAVTAAIPVVDTIKRVLAGTVAETLDRGELVAVQTPQAFRRDLLVSAHEHAAATALTADDDAALVEALGVSVHIVPGSTDNFKVTHPRDLTLLRALLRERR